MVSKRFKTKISARRKDLLGASACELQTIVVLSTSCSGASYRLEIFVLKAIGDLVGSGLRRLWWRAQSKNILGFSRVPRRHLVFRNLAEKDKVGARDCAVSARDG